MSSNDKTEQSTRPNQSLEEILAQLMRAFDEGQSIMPNEWLTRHPEFAVELKEYFEKQGGMEKLVRPLRQAAAQVLHVRCPHCHNPIELMEDVSLDEVNCPSCGSSFSLVGERTVTHYSPGEKSIAHFQLLDRVGIGAFGTVWKARDTKLDRIVALKIPRNSQLDKSQTELFLRDARAAAQLKHANIVGVHEVGKEDDTIFIVSDFIQGASLKQWMATKRLTLREIAALCAKIARALHHAHESGVIHRDLKPGNIMMDADGEPHIVDFGLAKREAGEITMTVEGQILGTPAYMSPEQAKGKGHSVDGRADVYSLGVILFELLTGELPFRGDKQMLIVQIVNDDPPSPRKLNRSVSRDVETICLKCLVKEPERRYTSALTLAEDLDRFFENKPIHARPVGKLGQTWRWCSRNPQTAGLMSAVFLLLAATIAILVWKNNQIASEMAKSVDAVVYALVIAEAEAVPEIVEKLKPLRQRALPSLRELFEEPSSKFQHRLHAAIAMSQLGEVKTDFLISSIPESSSEECKNIASALLPVKDLVSEQLLEQTQKADDPGTTMRLASVLLAIGDIRGTEHVLSLAADRTTRTEFVHSFPMWCSDWSTTANFLRNANDSGARSGICCALGLTDPSDIRVESAEEIKNALLEMFVNAPDGGTHSAAGWALRKWNVDLPKLQGSANAGQGNGWFSNGEGMTMVGITGGANTPATPLVQGFFIGDREVSVELFERFIHDANYPDEQKPQNWKSWQSTTSLESSNSKAGAWGSDPKKSPTPDCPVQNVNAFDAMLFCNWLSRREGREPCYAKSDDKWTVRLGENERNVQIDGWHCYFDRNGYRLPTIWEWRFVASDGAFPYHFGTENSMLDKYAWFNLNTSSRTQPVARLMPSPSGVFDIYGNVNEYCWARDENTGWFNLGGGDWSGDFKYCSLTTAFTTSPTTRSNKNGFRVICSDEKSQMEFTQKLANREQLFSKNRNSRNYAVGISKTYLELGERAQAGGNLSAAIEEFDRAIEALAILTEDKTDYFEAGQFLRDPYLKRAKLLIRLDRPADALNDWRFVGTLDGTPSATTLQQILLNAAATAKTGDYKLAAAAADEVKKLAPTNPILLYNIACVYSLCAGEIDKEVDVEEKNALGESYSSQAIALLGEAISKGFTDFNLLETDPDLDAIRSHDDFNQLRR